MSYGNSLKACQRAYSFARHVRFNWPIAISNVNLHGVKKRSKTGKKPSEWGPYRPFDNVADSVFVMCDDSLHENESATRADIGSINTISISADNFNQDEFSLQRDSVHQSEFAASADYFCKNEFTTPVASGHQNKITESAESVLSDETSNPAHVGHKDEIPSLTEILLRGNLRTDVAGDCVACRVKSVCLGKNEVTEGISRVPLVESIPSTYVSTEDYNQVTKLSQFEPVAFDACFGPMMNDSDNGAALPTITALQKETFNIDSLVCLSDEAATKIANLVLCSFNLGILLLEAIKCKNIVDVMDVLEYCVVKIMSSVAKKYLEMNKFILEEAIQMKILQRTEYECTPAVMVNEIDFSRFKEQSSIRNTFCNHYSSKRWADVSSDRNDLCQSVISSLNDESIFHLDESEFVTCEIRWPSASTPKSNRLVNHQISFPPVNRDLISTYNKTQTPRIISHIVGIEPNEKANDFLACNHQLALQYPFRTFGNALYYTRHKYNAEPQKYRTQPLMKITPETTLFYQEHDREVSESVERIADSSEKLFKLIQHEEQHQFRELQIPRCVQTSLSLLNEFPSCNEDEWYTGSRQSIGQFLSYDHYCGCMNDNFPRFITHNPRSGDHLSPNTNLGNTFAWHDQVGKGHFHSNCYSSDFHPRYLSPSMSPYPVYSQQPPHHHSVPHNVPNFLTLPENFSEPFRSAYQIEINRHHALQNETINPPSFLRHRCPADSNTFFFFNAQYPLEQKGYFQMDRLLDFQDGVRRMKLRTGNIHFIPEEVPSNCFNFRPTSSVSFFNNWSKPSIRSSISGIRGRDEGFDDLDHSDEISHLINSKQPPLPDFYFQFDFSKDSLNLSFGSNDLCKETENFGAVRSSLLSYSYVPSTKTIRKYSFSSAKSEFQYETNVRKKHSRRILTNARFPLLHGEFYNRYDSADRNSVQQNITSPTDNTLLTKPFPFRPCNSSLPYELEMNGLVPETRSKIPEKENCNVQCTQTRNVTIGVTSKYQDLFSADVVPIDSSYSDSSNESAKRPRLCDESYSTQTFNCMFNSCSVLTLSHEDLEYLEIDTNMQTEYKPNFHTSNKPFPTSATSFQTKLETKPRDDGNIYLKINQASVACQTNNWILYNEQEKDFFKNSQNSQSIERSLQGIYSYNDMSHENCNFVDVKNVCKCRDEQTVLKCPKKLKLKGLQCFCNQVCLYCQTLVFFRKHCHCSRRLNFCSKYTNISISGQRYVHPNRTCAVNNLTCCEAFLNHEWQNCRSPKLRCSQQFQPLCSTISENTCNCSKGCNFKDSICCSFKLAGERDFTKSRCWIEDCASCSEDLPNNRSNCCVHCRRVHKMYDSVEQSRRQGVCVGLHPSEVFDHIKSSICPTYSTCALGSHDKPKSRKSLFSMHHQSLKEASLLISNDYDTYLNCRDDRNINNRLFTGFLSDYCEIKRKLSLYAPAPQITQAFRVALNGSGDVCMNSKLKDSFLHDFFSQTVFTDANTLPKVDQYEVVKPDLKVSGNSERVDHSELLDDRLGNLSSVETLGGNECRSMLPRCGLITGNFCRNSFEQDCAAPSMIQSTIITPVPLHEHISPAPVELCSVVANGSAGIRSLEQGNRFLGKNRFTSPNSVIGAKDKLLENKCNKSFHVVRVEKNTVRKLVAIFEGLSRGNQ